MFRRRKSSRPEDPAAAAEPEQEPDLPDEPEPEQPTAGFDRSAGPYDVSELPAAGDRHDDSGDSGDSDDSDDSGEDSEDAAPAPDGGGQPARLDLGGLRVPVYEGAELRVEADQESGQIVAVTVVHGASAVQLHVFAAPRREGIWAEVRGELAAGVSSAGGTVDVVAGRFGEELHVMLPADPASGARGLVPARFVGVDGPRWFLRGLFTGPAARDAAAAELLETVLRGCVVVRGQDPMAPGDPLELRMPTELPAGLSAGGEAPSEDRRHLAPPQRGPEITEIR